MDSLNYIDSGNAAYIDSLYEAYKQDPESVDYGWQKFFEGFDFGKESQPAKAAAGAAGVTARKPAERNQRDEHD
jgi:2-oxoglutarate dehydrogenase E1 component